MVSGKTCVLAALAVIALLPGLVRADLACGGYVNESTVLSYNITGCTGTILYINASSVTLDCAGHQLESNGSYGINNTGFNNVTIRNCEVNMSSFGSSYAIYYSNTSDGGILDNGYIGTGFSTTMVFQNVFNLTVRNNTVAFFYGGISLVNSTGCKFENNTVKFGSRDALRLNNVNNSEVTGNDFFVYNQGCLQLFKSHNNTLSDNNITGGNSIFALENSTDNSVSGGTVMDRFFNPDSDYNVKYGHGNSFRNTNFTSRQVLFSDSSGWFSYNNETSGGIWLNTTVNKPSILERDFLNINQTLVQWNETNISGKGVVATYNISGLLPDTYYNVYNNSVLTYGLETDENGTLSQFTVLLGSEHEIKVEKDEEPPKYWDNSTNSTLAGEPVEFRLRWTDGGLSGYVFSMYNETYLSQGWWNSSFRKCRNITVNPMNDYQHRLVLNTTSFNYSLSNDDGSDVRIVNSSCAGGGQEMPYWIEEWNETSESVVWFRGDNSSTQVYSVYYNYTDAEPKSNGTEVFELFDDFSADTDGEWDYEASGNDDFYSRDMGLEMGSARLIMEVKINDIYSRNWAHNTISMGLSNNSGPDMYVNNSLNHWTRTNTDGGADQTHPECKFYARNDTGSAVDGTGFWITESETYNMEQFFNSTQTGLRVWDASDGSLVKSSNLYVNPLGVRYQAFRLGGHNCNGQNEFAWVSGSPSYLKLYSEGSNYGCDDSWQEFHVYWVFVSKYNSSESVSLGEEQDCLGGAWVNDSWSSFPSGGMEDWSNVTREVTGEVGATVWWKVYANDTSDNWNASENFTFVTANLAPPGITVVNPQNVTYNSLPIDLNITTNETAVWCGWNLNDTGSNTTMSGSGTVWWYSIDSIPQGTHRLYVYCNDSSGDMGFNASVYFTYDVTPPKYWEHSTNSTYAGEPVLFSLRWTDGGLDGYVFSLCNGTWNGTHCASGNEDYTSKSCNADGSGSSSGVACSGKNENGTDATADGCQDGTSNDWMHLEDIYINGTSFVFGDVVEVKCNVCCYSPGTEYSIAYSNGTGWVNIAYGNCNSGSGSQTCTGFENKSATFAVDSIEGNHSVRCIESWTGCEGAQTCCSGTYDDNDDLNFSVFSGTGGWQNDSWSAFPSGGTEDWSNITKTVNSTVGATVAWKFYANDTSGNWNVSGTYVFVTVNGSILHNLTGKILFWDNATPVSGATVTARIYDGEKLVGEQSNTTDSSGSYFIILQADLEKNRRYLANITAAKGSYNSYLKHYFRL